MSATADVDFGRWLEIGTNLADLVAFFLVTIDLYGRERLEALAARLRSAGRPPFPDLLLHPRWELVRRHWHKYAIWCGMFIFLGLFCAAPVLIGGPMPDVDDHGHVVFIITRPLALLFPLFALLLPLAFIFTWLLFFWLLISAGKIAAWLFDLVGAKARLDGAMLMAGAFIYVIARVVSIAAAYLPAK